MPTIYKVITLYEGVTAETELHVEYSRLAQDVTVEVTGGGSLISADIYGRAADLHMTEGTKRITVRGTPLAEAFSTLPFSVSRTGEIDVEDNPLITNDDLASLRAQNVANYLLLRNTYEVNYRGNPELETGDMVGLQTNYTGEMDAMMLTDELTFNGSLGGTALLKGLPQTSSIKLTQLIITVPAQKGYLYYTGQTLTPEWVGFNPDKLSVSGPLQAIDVGVYTVSFTPKAGCAWADGSKDAKNSSWVIDYASLAAVPVQDGTLYFTNDFQTPAWSGYDERVLTLEVTPEKEIGEYTARFTPKDGYEWWDGTRSAKEAPWTITEAQVIAPPETPKALEYNGSNPTDGTEQSPRWSGYSERSMTIDGDTAAIWPGEYTAIFTPNTGYIWNDMTMDAKTVPWKIERKSLKFVTASRRTFDVDGNAHYPTWTNYDADKMTIGGTTTAQSRPGIYETRFTPKNNFQWEDGTTDADTVKWGVGVDPSQTKLTIPSPGKTPTYNGEEQSPDWKNYEPYKMDVSGELTAYDAGLHYATFTPKEGFTWSDGTNYAATVEWEIKRANPNLKVTPTSRTVAVNEWAEFSYTSDYSWPNVEPEDESARYIISIVYGANNTFRVSANQAGTYRIKCISPEDSAGYAEQIVTVTLIAGSGGGGGGGGSSDLTLTVTPSSQTAKLNGDMVWFDYSYTGTPSTSYPEVEIPETADKSGFVAYYLPHDDAIGFVGLAVGTHRIKIYWPADSEHGEVAKYVTLRVTE